MARKKISRKIQIAPDVLGFSPIIESRGTLEKEYKLDHITINGQESGKNDKSGEIIMTLEEYESIKLCDYELLTQAEASAVMSISRPTFTRVYENARRKVAKAFVEGRSIQFKGGNYHSSEWEKCEKCNISYSVPEGKEAKCPICTKVQLNSGPKQYPIIEEIILCCDSQTNYESAGSGFGRCQWFGYLQKGLENIEFQENIYSDLVNEAGIKAADFILGRVKSGTIVIANHFGANVSKIFREKGIQMIIPSDNYSFKEILKKINR